jgi:hypothetical protein
MENGQAAVLWAAAEKDMSTTNLLVTAGTN